jgi:hypothetical protein
VSLRPDQFVDVDGLTAEQQRVLALVGHQRSVKEADFRECLSNDLRLELTMRYLVIPRGRLAAEVVGMCPISSERCRCFEATYSTFDLRGFPAWGETLVGVEVESRARFYSPGYPGTDP